VFVDLGALQRVVGLALALQRPLARRHAARAHRRARLARGCIQQFARRERRHLHVQVDAIEQRPRQAPLVARHLLGAAAARARRA
jgi:hypothetical protein